MRFDTDTAPNIYLNALKHRDNTFDVYNLFETSEQVENLLSDIFQKKEIACRLPVNNETKAKNLRHLFFEAKNTERIKGTKSLSLGFPMFVASNDKDFVVAPVFLINVELEPIQDREDSWALIKKQETRIRINPFLYKYFIGDFESDALSKIVELSEKGMMNLNAVKNFASDFAVQNELEIPSAYKVFPIPGIDEFGDISQKGKILWSGVLGVFPSASRYSASEDLEKAEASFIQNIQIDRNGKHPFGALETDPWQESAFRGALENENFLITGSTGTGKSQIAINVLINALSAGEKCLVISNRVSVLNKLQNRLSGLLNAPLHFLIKNEETEKNMYLAMLRARARSDMSENFDDKDWNFVVNKALREKKKLDHRYQSVNDPIFGNYNWTDTVGLFLKNNAEEGKEKLSGRLKVQDYSFTYEELEELEEGIQNCQRTYAPIQTMSHSLSELNNDIFLTTTAEKGLEFVNKNLDYFKTKSAALHRQFINRTDEYRSVLQNFYESRHRELSEKLEDAENFIQDSENRHGPEFSRGFYEWIGFKSYFSKESKTLYSARKTLVEKFETLQKSFLKNQPFESEFSEKIDVREVDLIREKITVFRKDLNNWRLLINDNIQDELIRLTNKSVNPNLPNYIETIQDLEEKLDILTDEINNAGLFQNRLANNTLTLPARQKYIEKIIEKLEETHNNLGQFDSFFDWQSNWLKLPVSGKKAIKALIPVKADNWSAAFKSWYLHNFLNKYQTPELPTEDNSLGEFIFDYLELKKRIPAQIASVWDKKKKKAIAEIKRNHRELYDYFDDRAHPDFLEKNLNQLLGSAARAATDLIPCIFCTPRTAFEFLENQSQPIFDRIIFEEAQLLNYAQCLELSKLGKQRLIIGDPGPVSSESEDNFSERIAEQNIPSIQLQKQFGERITDLTNFNAVAFPTEGFSQYNQIKTTVKSSVRTEAVNGRFSEEELTNDAEAHHVLHLLNQIRQTPQRTYPSVGIACFTTEQRNLILHYLQDIKKRNASGAETIRHLERNGMGVFHIRNMTAEQFDIVIVSMTFGALNTRGKMTNHIKQLNTQKGLRKIYSLADAPRKELIFLHSLPQSHIDTFANDSGQSGLFRLANFIKYGDALSKNNRQEAISVLQKIRTLKPEPKYIPESIFNDEVARILTPYFEAGRIGQNLDWLKMNIPLYTKNSEGKLQNFISADGFISNAPNTSYLHEFRQREKIKAAKVDFIPIWSVLWWKQPEEEARKLAGHIIQAEKHM